MSARPSEPLSPTDGPSFEAVRRAVDAAPDGILAIDRNGMITFANPMACMQFGYPEEEMTGLQVDELLPADVRGGHAAHRAGYVSSPRPRPMGSGLDLRGRRRSGEEFPLEISLSPVVADGAPFVVAIVRDVTERKRADDELRAAHEALTLVDDRERIARNLHDTVIQRLFAVGLSLQGVLMRSSDPDVVGRIEQAVDEIDATIRDLRTAIFSLHARSASDDGIRSNVLELTREAARALGFEPHVQFDGLLDTAVGAPVTEQLLPTLREALSNVSRHAQATAVWVSVEVHDTDVELCVADDGVGIGPEATAGDGLGNMTNRARSLGGSCRVEPRADGGTVMTWRVPLG